MEATVKLLRSNSELHRQNTNRKFIPVEYIRTFLSRLFYKSEGFISNHFIIGGYDNSGAHIFVCEKYGSTMKLPYATMGSGGYISMAVIESQWKQDMSEEDAKELVADAITAGIRNDLGSGSNVDVCVIKKNSAEKIRSYREIAVSGQKQMDLYVCKRGTTGVISTIVKKIDVDVIEERVQKMEVD